MSRFVEAVTYPFPILVSVFIYLVQTKTVTFDIAHNRMQMCLLFIAFSIRRVFALRDMV